MLNSFLKNTLAISLASAACAGTLLCQTPPVSPQTPAQPPSQMPAQTPNQTPSQAPGQTPGQTPAPALPPPVPGNAGDAPAMPGYSQQPGTSQTIQSPTPAGPPVAVPATTTPQQPFAAMPGYQPYGIPDEDKPHHTYGSTYIPVDSWVYDALTRLYSMGFANTMFLGMRPVTRQSLLHILNESEDDIRDSDNEEAQEIYTALMKELRLEAPGNGAGDRGTVYGVESVYGRALGISGLTLRDSYHLGQSIVNDYGRPYQPGFNSLLGFSTINEYGRFSLYVRGEYQHAPSAAGYSTALANYLVENIDQIVPPGKFLPHGDIPAGPIAAENPFRLQEATLSFHVLGHEISGGKSDAWLGPAQGGALAWSNNAENIYSFRINRVEPMHIPLLSRVLGPLRYDFFYGSLKGHTTPNDDWTHSAMFSFRPTSNFEFGFQRTVVFGGHGHEPVTLHTFLKSFFDISDTTPDEKASRNDPGARYSDFNMSWRLPFVRKYVTFYADSIAHDDVTPPSAPRRAAFRTGLYLSHIPAMPKLDFRFEAVDTDPITTRSTKGEFNYFETVQRQAYTNQGFIMGDWIGREAKGGQAWLTYHLSGNELVQFEFLNKKNDKDFSPGAYNPAIGTFNLLGGTTQNSGKISVVKRLHHDDIEVNAWFQYEKWKAPAYMAGPQSDTSTAVQITFFPGLKSTGSK